MRSRGFNSRLVNESFQKGLNVKVRRRQEKRQHIRRVRALRASALSALRVEHMHIRCPLTYLSRISEDFWTTSTCDMDNSAVQSQGSISSISTSNQTLDLHGSVATANAPAEFVNHGKFSAPKLLCLLLWNQIRQSWVGNRRSQNRKQLVQEPKLNWNATYENLLGSNKPFPQPIPLSEMIDFLVDVWEQEGLYD
ncbi:hypothetical protein GOBAR_AA24529 [Gossypium barbadense]|uniref:Gag1-like clamp domain-containing protein n=1 Tax=Gossypium barbadense TaxID=3634 RepID=A0A2P5WYM4_GOSBA|nr:hypothetical protein GOBAR_AA24529 [Gossypium barbadense]